MEKDLFWLELDIHWRDVDNLISGIGGWKQRKELNMSRFLFTENGGVIWHTGNSSIYLMAKMDNTSTVILHTDNNAIADIEALRTWKELELLLSQYKTKEWQFSKIEYNEIMKKLSEFDFKLAKNKKSKKIIQRKNKVPIREAERRNWAILWAFIETKVIAENLNARSLRNYLNIYHFDDKPDWIPRDDDTLQKIINEGKSQNIPKLNEI